MNLRWLIGNFADPEFGLTRKQEHAVTWLAHRKYLSSKKLALWTLGMVVVSYLAVGFGSEPLAALFFSAGIPWPRNTSLIFICGSAVVFAAWMYRYLYRKPMLMALRELHYEVCIDCGYRMQGLDESIAQCPECGATREPMRRQKLEACDLANPAIVQAMQSLGYTVCRECGLMILDPSNVVASNCPDCGSPRNPMLGRPPTED